VDVQGKRVAVIGTGATGVQIVQEWAKTATETFVFQRTPNFALPMRQQKFDEIAQNEIKKETADLLARCRATETGQTYPGPSKKFSDYSLAESEEILNGLYDEGGLRYWSGAYMDQLGNPKGNRLAYDVWAKRTRERIHDPVKRDLLAPLEPPHPFGTKRPSLEQDYFEQFNKPHVHIVDTKAHPIEEVTPQGIRTNDGTLYKVDIIAIATGFDASTGGLTKMGIKGLNGIDLETRWRDGVSSFLGLMVPGFPNMFLPYSVQAPSPFTNSPVLIELQASFIRDLMKKMESDGVRYINPKPAAAAAWKSELQKVGDLTLFPRTASWYMGANIPAKKVEMLYFFGGMSRYRQKCAEALGVKFKGSFVCYS
jgi:cation diffusion facilitator CzcD-associated flavoprotein CzcO